MKLLKLLAATAGLGAVLEALVTSEHNAKCSCKLMPQGALRSSGAELTEALKLVEDLDHMHGMVADLKDVMVVVDATSEISVVDRPGIAVFLAGERFLTRLLEAHLVCKTNDLSEVRFRDVPLQWGDDLFRKSEQLPSAMGEVVVDRRGEFWFSDERRNDNGRVESVAMSILGLISKVMDQQATGLVILTDDSDAVHGFSCTHARFQMPGAYVIRSESEGAYWNNDMGWSGLEEATVFNRVERDTFALPASSSFDAAWVSAQSATEAAATEAATI